MSSHTPDGKLWYSINEASQAAGVSRRTIYNYIKAGKLGETRRTPGGAVRIDAELLLIARSDTHYHVVHITPQP